MKTMTCRQLAGACDMEFHAETFDEIAEVSRKHAMEMAEKHDEAHLKAMDEMKGLMKEPEAMKEWMRKKREEFEALPEDK